MLLDMVMGLLEQTHVYRFEAQIQNSKVTKSSVTSSEVMIIESYLLSIDIKKNEVILVLLKRKDDLEKAIDALLRMNKLLEQ